MEQECDQLLQKNWTEEQKSLIKRILENVLYYKKILPKTLKNDIISALKMCNELKDELDELKNKCTTE